MRPGKEWLARWLLSTLHDDISQKQPELIMVVRTQNMQTPDIHEFDFMRWFQTDPRMTQVMDLYTLASTSDLSCSGMGNTPYRCIHQLFIRKHRDG